MRVLRAVLSFIILVPLVLAADDYELGPDSMPQSGVPKGKVTQMPPWKSQIFDGTVRDWWLYVPNQYDGTRAACVMVFQDGGSATSTTRDSSGCPSSSTT
jgi:hypothetical protein